MSDDQFNRNNENRNKSIDVTKPRANPQQSQSHIDASRVSAYTLREQQALDKLKKQVGNLNQKENRASSIKTVIAIILVVILIVLAVVFVILIGRSSKKTPEGDYDMRLSMQIENKSALSIITEAGQEKLREINPGDKIPLRATVRNSQDISGELTNEGTQPPSIFVRYRLVLILDYEERYDIMVPTVSDKWYRYNQEVEEGLYNGAVEDDHYFYYLGTLAFMEPQVLFSQIEFDGDAITCDDGGKYGQIQVHVESIEAEVGNLVSKTLWPTAPQGWISQMIEMITGGGSQS